MPTNLDLDDRLIEAAKRLGKHRTKKAAVTEALEEYVQRRRQQQVIALFGSVDYDASYDHKAERERR